MTFSERDVRFIIAELEAACWRVRTLIRAWELASSHGLEQMRRVRMLEMQEAWKRKGGFDRIEIIVETHSQNLRRLHTGFDSEPLYTGLYNNRWPPDPKEYTLEMNVEVERLRLEILFL